MSITERIQRDIRRAMKERDRARLGALRMINAALENARIEAGKPLSEEEELAVLRRQLKQREESARAFREGGRPERAEAEEAEAEVVRGYLPEPLSGEEMSRLVEQAIRETGATGMKDMGAVMGRAMQLAGGRAEGQELATLVRQRLQ
ncbi:putative protein YqeY [Rubrobacter xylanophilus DSM 9941]|uniref:GatB/YqeY domain-containing protein n=1 Tax=Rubrobacter xylanophilus TaxID=49319 RepID=UPI001C63BCB3|nr:GatB/YqeY domain-containing protein [Rubrobacter xylanophilus]QYJ14747.1 putative protein YqeY [Rubrobacter xylanophilus DSM 9941]